MLLLTGPPAWQLYKMDDFLGGLSHPYSPGYYYNNRRGGALGGNPCYETRDGFGSMPREMLEAKLEQSFLHQIRNQVSLSKVAVNFKKFN